MISLYEAQKALTRYDWDLWVTATFPESIGWVKAKKEFRNFLKRLNQKHGPLVYKNVIHGFAEYEKNKSRPGVHVHAVLFNVPLEMAGFVAKSCQYYLGVSTVGHVHEGVIPYMQRKLTDGSLAYYEPFKVNARKRVKSICY